MNPGMYRVSITCKKLKKCPRVIKTVDVDAQRKLAHSLSVSSGHFNYLSSWHDRASIIYSICLHLLYICLCMAVIFGLACMFIVSTA